MILLNHKVIVITGATGGIGQATARQCVKKGWTVVLIGRAEQTLVKLHREIIKNNSESRSFLLDVTSQEKVLKTIKEILSHYGKVDAWINNAGYGLFSSLEESNLHDYHGMMETNYFGTVYCTKGILPSLIKQGDGTIINVASVGGLIPTAKSGGYAASKAATIQFTRCIRQEIRGTGVRVFSINPGPVETPFFDYNMASRQYRENIKSFMISPEKVALAIIKGIEKGNHDVILPWYMGIGSKLYHLFPRFYEKVISPLADKK